MNAYLSKKISILSFIAIFCVLIIHSYFLENNVWKANAFIQNFVGGSLIRFCIPLFFFLSGYLFFKGTQEGGIYLILKKMKSRVRTLVLPYVLWNGIFFLSIILLQLCPFIGSRINSDFLSRCVHGDWADLAIFIFWEPAGFHLWFLKYLIIFIASCPLIYLLFQRRGPTWILAFATITTIGIYGWGGENMQGLPFFLFGAYLAFQNISIDRISRKTSTYISLSVYSAWCMANTLFPEFQIPQLELPKLALGTYAVWALYDQLAPVHVRTMHTLSSCSKYTFFIYVLHEPWINIYKKLITMYFPSNQYILLLAYFTTPAIMMITCIFVARILQKRTHSMYSVLTGGRN